MRTRFLIVDDSDLVRRSLRMVLQANPDWEICGEAADGVSAVEMFKELRPNVVILDFQMPGIAQPMSLHFNLARAWMFEMTSLGPTKSSIDLAGFSMTFKSRSR